MHAGKACSVLSVLYPGTYTYEGVQTQTTPRQTLTALDAQELSRLFYGFCSALCVLL